MKVIKSVDDALATIGEELGVSRWVDIDQSRIDAFADVTMDHQWIHVDVEKAKAESPYGATIAHGFLTLSLIPGVSKDNYRVENAKMGINYGLNKVRFLSAVTAGSRDPGQVRARGRRQGGRRHREPDRASHRGDRWRRQTGRGRRTYR